MRALAASSLGFLLTAVASGQPGRYRADPIPAFWSSGIRIAYALTPDGQACGTQTVRTFIENGQVRRLDAGFVFDGTRARAVLPAAEGLATAARAVSPGGVLVGAAADGAVLRAAILSPEAPPVFLPLGGVGSTAQGVNDAGVVVGSLSLEGGIRRAFVWSAQRGLQDPLGPEALLCTAFAVNAAGMVVGEFTPPGGPKRAFVLRAGGAVAEDLNAALPAGTPWSLEQGWAVNEAGVVACNGTLRAGVGAGAEVVGRAALVFPEAPGSPVELAPTPGMPATIVYSLNVCGEAVGLSLVSLALGPRRPTLWRDGEAIDLGPRTLNADPRTIWNSVTAINDRGQILAQWLTPAGENLLVRLTPLCDADQSGDGQLGPVDVELFLERFDREGVDFDEDGFCDFFDVVAFFDAYDGRSGCGAR